MHNVLLRRRFAADENMELIARCKHAQPTSADERRLMARVVKALDRMDAAVLRLNETLMLFTLMSPRSEDPLILLRPAGAVHDAQRAVEEQAAEEEHEGEYEGNVDQTPDPQLVHGHTWGLVGP